MLSHLLCTVKVVALLLSFPGSTLRSFEVILAVQLYVAPLSVLYLKLLTRNILVYLLLDLVTALIVKSLPFVRTVPFLLHIILTVTSVLTNTLKVAEQVISRNCPSTRSVALTSTLTVGVGTIKLINQSCQSSVKLTGKIHLSRFQVNKLIINIILCDVHKTLVTSSIR